MDQLSTLLSPLDTLIRTGASPFDITWEGMQFFDRWLQHTPSFPLRSVKPGSFGGRLLFEHPNLGYIVVLMSWNAGATTPIHDHNTWGLMGVLQGQLELTNFEKTEEENVAQEVARFVAETGDVSRLVSPDMDIHRIHNPGPSIAQSLHIYGRNIGF